MLQHAPQIFSSSCLAHTEFINGRYFTFHSDVMLPHFLSKHLILCLWLVSTNVWCRADGGFCVRRAFVGEYVDMECIIVTVDLGDWPLWKTNYNGSACLCVVVFPQNWSSEKSENLPKTIRQTGAEADCQASLLCPRQARGIPWVHISLSFPQFPRRNRHVLGCLDNKLYLIRSASRHLTQFS